MSTYIEGFRIALSSIFTNRTRAALTTLGIMIGVAAVISLISLGRGVEKFVVNEFNTLGANMLIVAPRQPEDEDVTRIEKLTTRDVVNLTDPSIAPSVEQVAPQFNVSAIISDMGESMQTMARGVTPNYPEVRNWQLASGRFITQGDIDSYNRVAVVGLDVIEEVYDDDTYDPTGNVVRVNGLTFTIVGVMADRDDPFNNDNGAIIVPLSVAQTRLANANTRGGYEVSIMYVQAQSEEETHTAEEEIDAYFAAERGLTVDQVEQKDYDINNLAEQLEIAATITALLTVFLGIIASVSLLVGGIGIMNIMLVTVTERTQEIGLRKALGAQPRDILVQFLFESVILSLLGGIIGILLGWLVAEFGTRQVAALTLTVDLDAILLATLVSTAIGVGFGLFPANRAARMNPIDALRFE